MARVIPPLYKETHKDAYTGQGVYYKGAPAAVITAVSMNLSNAAQLLGSGATQAVDVRFVAANPELTALT